MEDPDYVLGGLDAGEFSGRLLVQAEEACRRASRIWPCSNVPQDVTVFYFLNSYDPTRLGGFTVVRTKDRRVDRYKKMSAAESAFLDLSLPRRIAPLDSTATQVVLGGVKLAHCGRHDAILTQAEAEDFFNNPNCIAG